MCKGKGNLFCRKVNRFCGNINLINSLASHSQNHSTFYFQTIKKSLCRKKSKTLKLPFYLFTYLTNISREYNHKHILLPGVGWDKKKKKKNKTLNIHPHAHTCTHRALCIHHMSLYLEMLAMVTSELGVMDSFTFLHFGFSYFLTFYKEWVNLSQLKESSPTQTIFKSVVLWTCSKCDNGGATRSLKDQQGPRTSAFQVLSAVGKW